MAVYEVREVTSESGSYLDGFRKVRNIKINEQPLLFQILEKGLFCSWLHWMRAPNQSIFKYRSSFICICFLKFSNHGKSFFSVCFSSLSPSFLPDKHKALSFQWLSGFKNTYYICLFIVFFFLFLASSIKKMWNVVYASEHLIRTGKVIKSFW